MKLPAESDKVASAKAVLEAAKERRLRAQSFLAKYESDVGEVLYRRLAQAHQERRSVDTSVMAFIQRHGEAAFENRHRAVTTEILLESLRPYAAKVLTIMSLARLCEGITNGLDRHWPADAQMLLIRHSLKIDSDKRSPFDWSRNLEPSVLNVVNNVHGALASDTEVLTVLRERAWPEAWDDFENWYTDFKALNELLSAGLISEEPWKEQMRDLAGKISARTEELAPKIVALEQAFRPVALGHRYGNYESQYKEIETGTRTLAKRWREVAPAFHGMNVEDILVWLQGLEDLADGKEVSAAEVALETAWVTDIGSGFQPPEHVEIVNQGLLF